MATYYALASDGKIQYNWTSGHLEIYEKESDAERNKRSNQEVVEVEVKRTDPKSK